MVGAGCDRYFESIDTRLGTGCVACASLCIYDVVVDGWREVWLGFVAGEGRCGEFCQFVCSSACLHEVHSIGMVRSEYLCLCFATDTYTVLLGPRLRRYGIPRDEERTKWGIRTMVEKGSRADPHTYFGHGQWTREETDELCVLCWSSLWIQNYTSTCLY